MVESTSLGGWLFERWLRSPLSPVPRRGEEDAVSPGDAKLRPETDLSEKLFGWPDIDFAPDNCVISKFGHEPHKQKAAGDVGIDFSLPTTTGTSVRLSELLKKGPVLMCAVAPSCPHCVAYASDMETFAKEVPITCLAVTVMSPHPENEMCFETGKKWEVPHSKGVSQAKTLEERLRWAELIKEKMPSWVVVADDLSDKINPWWSTYGPAPRCAYLVHATGLICHSWLWWEPDQVRTAVQAYLAQVEQA
ncbi:hypothetical protein CTAYLR_002597 [Chrysophaeum taylorii]|uniref:Redoxin domain-containing protein n=1 Tax=Chrysophaeum taylorii TaxID=2483200 RepID=A0AAD7UF72_9STRA|nr:hypothetical protein CTAYLR_002597 [Chrysophaeum taylorii]